MFGELKNPYYVGDNPALTQTAGWVPRRLDRAAQRLCPVPSRPGSASRRFPTISFRDQRRIVAVIDIVVGSTAPLSS